MEYSRKIWIRKKCTTNTARLFISYFALLLISNVSWNMFYKITKLLRCYIKTDLGISFGIHHLTIRRTFLISLYEIIISLIDTKLRSTKGNEEELVIKSIVRGQVETQLKAKARRSKLNTLVSQCCGKISDISRAPNCS